MLIQRGTCASECDDDGLTAADHARANGHGEALAILTKEASRIATLRELLAEEDQEGRVSRGFV